MPLRGPLERRWFALEGLSVLCRWRSLGFVGGGHVIFFISQNRLKTWRGDKRDCLRRMGASKGGVVFEPELMEREVSFSVILKGQKGVTFFAVTSCQFFDGGLQGVF